MLINRENLDIFFTGVKTTFNKGFEGAPSLYRRIATVVPSQTREESYTWLGALPKMREWTGDRVINNLALHDYKIKNKTFEQTISPAMTWRTTRMVPLGHCSAKWAGRPGRSQTN